MQFRDLKTQYKLYEDEISIAISKVLKESNFINGEEVNELESRLAAYVGVKNCITCANGTDALWLVLMAWNIGPGDAVFVPDFTFFATAEVVSLVGATPIFVDVDKYTYNIDPIQLDKKILEVKTKTKLNPKVIIPVDLFGLCADYSVISKIANKYNLLVLEDAAQGFGAEVNGKKACSFGDAATTSFFPAKPLGCYGDGGAIFTDDDSLANILRSLRMHGKGSNKYDNIRVGVNSRLDTLQAAILNVKLNAFIDHELTDVNRVFSEYNKKLAKKVVVPFVPEGFISSFAQYTIQLKSKSIRDGLQEYLTAHGIPTMIYYQKGLHSQIAYKELNNSDEDFPVTNILCSTVLSLPMHPYIQNSDIYEITKHIIKYLDNNQ